MLTLPDIMPGLGLLSGELVSEETCGIWISCLMWMGFVGQEEPELGAPEPEP